MLTHTQLLNARDEESGKPLSNAALMTEGTLLILAGSDTTSTGKFCSISAT
jgi:cytochrome P450